MILGMNVWQLVALIIEEIEIDDYPVEHADGWHSELNMRGGSKGSRTQNKRGLSPIIIVCPLLSRAHPSPSINTPHRDRPH